MENCKAFDLPQLFGSNVFDDRVMRERLPKETYKELKRTLDEGGDLTTDIANVIANAMKDWAIEKGATHYTHWFQPLTGFTAEKHDSFITPTPDGGVLMEFSGKQLIQGEPDASSFPSGGLRATFEARGYTAWDATSPAFLKEDAAGNVTLCIPTAFCSYTSEALDKKTPLLRSMKAVSEQALRVLRALGNTTSKRVTAMVGPEQEYFLVDKRYYAERLDLITTGRTLFGASAPKGQEMDDHYFGAIKDRVSEFMKDLDMELWKMGITSKTKHNEVAPAQYEMAPIFTTTNIATDHNQIVMETLQKVALRHDLVCLLHEKPYAGINGSGKHNNWSLGTDDGINLLDPGHTPHRNQTFLVFLSALIKSVDKHADILRASAANSGNDFRLGANEAPPAIISIFMGEELTDILEKLAKGEKVTKRNTEFLNVGVDTLPPFPMDNSDRNRTSPFAFTGNKFEFRMVGSSASISGPNIILNTIVAEALDEIATRFENAADINEESAKVIRETINRHGRIIFNGNGYSDEWIKEAERRGLPNINNTADAHKSVLEPKSVEMFDKYKVLSPEELKSRYEIYVEQYSLQVNIEAQTAISMARKQYIPAVIGYTGELAGTIDNLNRISAPTTIQEEQLRAINSHLSGACEQLLKLENAVEEAKAVEDVSVKAELYRDKVRATMEDLRVQIDTLELLMPKNKWPVPTYDDLLFRL